MSNSNNADELEHLFWGQNKWHLNHVPPVSPSESHTVLYQIPLPANRTSPPKPYKGHNKWDTDHVRLPSAVQNQYPVKSANGETVIEKRWELIQTALLQPIYTCRDLEKAILSYNTKYDTLWKFTALHKLFEDELEEEESFAFFEITLPNIIRLALQLPELFLSAVPLLKQRENKSLSMSQQQVACLLANAFLCTFPRRNTRKKNSEYSSFPDINFNRLYQAPEQKVLEKLKCICNYFRRITQTPPTGVLTFIRRHLSDNKFPNLDITELKFSSIPIHVSADGTIEENGKGMLQVDFANKFIGGGVLRSGAVQEEIRFVLCPELLVTRLFIELLRPNEAIIIVGSEQFNSYTGYANTFAWKGNYLDETPYDSSGRRKTHIVAIDALHFIHEHHQYKEELMLREVKKAYVGFMHTLKTAAPPVASGNWGCGAFKGSSHLKSLLQLIVCVLTKRPLLYFTFNDSELCDSINQMHQFLCNRNVSVGELWNYLKLFSKENLNANQLYPFIYQQKLTSNSSQSIPQAIFQSIKRSFTPKSSSNLAVKATKVDITNVSSERIEVTDLSSPLQTDIEMVSPERVQPISKITSSNVEKRNASPPKKMSALDCLDAMESFGKRNKSDSKSKDYIITIENDVEDFAMEEDDDEIIPESPENVILNRRYSRNSIVNTVVSASTPSTSSKNDIEQEIIPETAENVVMEEDDDEIIPESPENEILNKRYSSPSVNKVVFASTSSRNDIEHEIIPATPENVVSSKRSNSSNTKRAAPTSSTSTSKNEKYRQKGLLDYFNKK